MKYVKIKDRVFIESAECAGFPDGIHRLYVLIDDSGVARCVGTSKYKQVQDLTYIRKALRVACANMRERCAEEAEALGESHIAAAIREREL